YMISHFTHKDTDEKAVEAAMAIAKRLDALGAPVRRVKVEGHSAAGTPQTQADYVAFEKYVQSKYAGAANRPYFEFHVHVGEWKGGHIDGKQLEECIRQFKGTAIS